MLKQNKVVVEEVKGGYLGEGISGRGSEISSRITLHRLSWSEAMQEKEKEKENENENEKEKEKGYGQWNEKLLLGIECPFSIWVLYST